MRKFILVLISSLLIVGSLSGCCAFCTRGGGGYHGGYGHYYSGPGYYHR